MTSTNATAKDRSQARHPSGSRYASTPAVPSTVDSAGKTVRAGDTVRIVATGLGAYPRHVGHTGTVTGVARLRAWVQMEGETSPRRMHPSQMKKVRQRHLAAV